MKEKIKGEKFSVITPLNKICLPVTDIYRTTRSGFYLRDFVGKYQTFLLAFLCVMRNVLHVEKVWVLLNGDYYVVTVI